MSQRMGTVGCWFNGEGGYGFIRPGMDRRAEEGRKGRRKTWSDVRAWRLCEWLETELRTMQATGWRASQRCLKRSDVLVEERFRAEEAHDMAAYERNAFEMLKLCAHDFRMWLRRERATRDGHGDPGG